jgi:long-chain acyl-CoA synthetase
MRAMEVLHATPDIEKKIRQAQTFQGSPPEAFRSPAASVATLLAAHAARTPGSPCLIAYADDPPERREWTYAALWERVCRTANALAGLGLGRGDRLATLCVNADDTVVTYLAALALGAVVVPVNPGEDDARVHYVLEHSEARLLVHQPEFEARAAALAKSLPGLRHRVHAGSRPSAGATALADLADAASAAPPDPAAAGLDDEALIVYTSGTTGPPKGVVLCHRNLLADARGIADWHRLGPGDRLMCVLPIHHVNGIVVTLMTPLWCGGSVVLNRKFRTETFWERLATEGVQVVSVVPTLLQYLLQDPERAGGVDLSRFRHIICGAGPLTVELAASFEDRFGLRIVHGYGLSETTCYSCFLPVDLAPAEHKRWMRDFGFPSIGVPIPPNEMAIHDAFGKPLGPGQRGEIVIRGHNVMLHYFRRPEANADTFKFGWFRSGDEGFYELGSKGRPFFFITGRIKELIIRGGVNLSPFEVDEVLMRIPGVRCGLAVGFDNKWYGEEVGAYVVLREGSALTAEEILVHCRKALPFAKAPKVVVFGTEVPATSTGKYQRNRLKPCFESYRDVQFREPAR